MKTLLALLVLCSAIANAQIHKAPDNFDTQDGKAVWVDFKKAIYEITYYRWRFRTKVVSYIDFEMTEAGLPIFDLKATPSKVLIDGVKVAHKQISDPDNISKMRIALSKLEPGRHTLEVHHRLRKGVKYGLRGISSAFWIRDLKNREMLERYLPTNYEYDSYEMNMHIKIKGSFAKHNIFANGTVENIAKNEFIVKYPNFYTSSSVFFHLVPKSKFKRVYFDYSSINGTTFPVTIYSHSRILNSFLKKKAVKTLKELENDYGAWPHPKLIIYGTLMPRGGMEYVGSTETSYVSLAHELLHSYFAKGVMPTNGNSGWLDEAIASWRDNGYQKSSKPFYESAGLAAHSQYTRKTDSRSYKYGRSFLAYINLKLQFHGLSGLKEFLRKFFKERVHTTVTTDIFKSELESWSGLDLSDDFNQYILGQDIAEDSKSSKRSPHHPIVTEKDLKSIL